jgi:hypothetical protein
MGIEGEQVAVADRRSEVCEPLDYKPQALLQMPAEQILRRSYRGVVR